MPKINWDYLGIASSVACAIHCALLPMLLSTLPIMGIDLVDNMAFENFMILLAFVLGVYSLWHGFRKHHHSLLPLLVFLMGILLLIAKQIWHEYQLWFLTIAVPMIVFAHLLNYRSCRTHRHAHADDCNH